MLFILDGKGTKKQKAEGRKQKAIEEEINATIPSHYSLRRLFAFCFLPSAFCFFVHLPP